MSKRLLLFLFVFIALFLRFWGLGLNPPSLTWDEAAWGYNAYSLGIDGRDEFGKFLPVTYIESFGDFKPPVYAYLDIVPVKLLGLNEFSTRFPSALFGTLTVLLTFFLVREIFYNSKNKDNYALFATLFMVVSPWHIMLSRAAFEANVATFFIVSGVYLSFLGVRKNLWFLSLSVISFIVSMYTFNSARIVSPLLLIFLLVYFRDKLVALKKEIILAALLGSILFLPLGLFLLTPQASTRFKEVNIFSSSVPVELANTEIKNDGGVFWSNVIHNRRVIYSIDYLRHYFDNLTPNFLFIRGDGNPKFSTQDVGELLLWDLPFFILGSILIFKKREGRWWIIPVWLVLGIIPAAVARETPHALRIETTLPTFQIITAVGFVNLVRKKKYLLLALVLLSINFLYFYHGLLSSYPKEFSSEWQYGYKESIRYVESVKQNYKEINITEELGRPYIYYLFYEKYTPLKFREEAVIKRDAFGFVSVESFNKYHFYRNVNGVNKTGDLYINTPDKIPSFANVVKTFYLLNGQPALVAYTL